MSLNRLALRLVTVAALSGRTLAGAAVRDSMITPPDDEAITLTVVEVAPGRSFTDRFTDGGVVVDTLHHVDTIGTGRTRVVYRTQITGPAADEVGPAMGPEITADFPEVVAALIERASS